MNKPELSAEMEKKLMSVVHENWHSGAGEIIDFNKFLDELKHFLATALEEQKKKTVMDCWYAILDMPHNNDTGYTAELDLDEIYARFKKIAILNGKGE